MPPPAPGAGGAAHHAKVATRFMLPTSFARLPADRNRLWAQTHTAIPAGASEKTRIETCLREWFPRSGPSPTLTLKRRARWRSAGSHNSAWLHAPEIPATACFLFDTTQLPAPRRAKSGSRPVRPTRVAKRKPEIDKKCAAGSVSREQGTGIRDQGTGKRRLRSENAGLRDYRTAGWGQGTPSL